MTRNFGSGYNQKVDVLLLNTNDGFGGGEFYTRDLARGLEYSDLHTLTFIAGKQSTLRNNLESFGLRVEMTGRGLRYSRPWSVAHAAVRLRAAIRRYRPRTIYCNLPRSVILGRLAIIGMIRRPQVVGVLHSPLGRDLLSSLSATGLRSVMTNTDWVRHEIQRRLPHARVAVLSPVAQPPASPPEIGDRRYITMIGRFQSYKGHRDFIRCAHALLKEVPNTEFHVVGAVTPADNAYIAELRELINRLGIGDRLRLDLSVPEEVLTDLLSKTAVYVHPAAREDFGISLVEAMLAGCDVVAYEAEGPKKILGQLPHALVEVGDVDGLARAVRRAFERRSVESMAQVLLEGERFAFGKEYAARCAAANRAFEERDI